ncbi:Argininosuccinate lyase [Pyrolobus fumarii 1A]|uniref:Argininosuccinate lyase n=1 Tax=Pyrolobus fumarii (strain DSM 11204 / 1A) TaxID=694429 RepID=G0EDD7_PYRF1|nr:Argininosuccinate lyase [Pyrolobus fumarii 1A]
MSVRTVYREGMKVSKLVQDYISSTPHDHMIAHDVVKVALIHVAILAEHNLLDKSNACKLANALQGLLKKPEQLLEAMKGYEDIHEALEAVLEDKAGREAARSFPLGRSRNDHVAAALRLWTARMLTQIHCEGVELAKTILKKAEEWLDTLFPIHTHFQPAQVGTAGHWIHSYLEPILDALSLIETVFNIAWKSPLGSGPGAGTTLPIDRRRYPQPPVLNTLYATGSRLFANAAIAAVAVLMIELSRLAADVVLLSHPSIRVLVPPEHHVSTSSAMPHKRNPVSAEIARARAARVAGLLAAALGVNHGLPHGYNLDLQEENPVLYQALTETLETLRVFRDLVEGLEVDGNAVRRMIEGGAVLTSLEEAERLAVNSGTPFRDAYMMVADMVRRSEGSLKPLEPQELYKLRVSLGAAGEGLQEALRESQNLLNQRASACTRLVRLLDELDAWIESRVKELCR